MDPLHWPLSVLSKAVHYKNLTGASGHVGLSQPQLSRLIAQLEEEYDVVLLDRTAKRKSAWTPAAHRLAEVYEKSTRKLQVAIQELLEQQIPKETHIGTLEGLSPIALHIADTLFKETKTERVDVNVYDLNELDEKFLSGDLDMIISIRQPGKQKLKHSFVIGHQTMKSIKGPGVEAMSPYEEGVRKKKKDVKRNVLVSNNLAVRKTWIRKYGGGGNVPGPIKKQKGEDTYAITVLANEFYHDSLWAHIQSINFSSDITQD